jgi:NAD(P)-dependent dehydrogenase (short-subunit alcohol dehydrogenase family)
MNSRRDFLNIALKGSAMVAATRLLFEAASASNPTSIAASGVIAQTPLGRIGRPNDIAPVAVFLASAESSWITGEIIHVSGGLR